MLKTFLLANVSGKRPTYEYVVPGGLLLSQKPGEGEGDNPPCARKPGSGLEERSNCLCLCLWRPLDTYQAGSWMRARLMRASFLPTPSPSPFFSYLHSTLFSFSPAGDATSREAALTTVSVYLTPWMKNDNEVQYLYGQDTREGDRGGW